MVTVCMGYLTLGVGLLYCGGAGAGQCSLSEFKMAGDFILGGLFELHSVDSNIDLSVGLPVALECQRFKFVPASYTQMLVMRFAIEEINNSSSVLPGVRLGYRLYDYCSEAGNFRAVLDFLSSNGSVTNDNSSYYSPKVISATGPFGSTKTLTVAPLFMTYLVPMVTYGATSVQLSNRRLYPSFFRTVPSDRHQVKAIIRLLNEFHWNWVAFIGSDGDYSQDALAIFMEEIRSSDICLAYQGIIPSNISKSDDIFHKMQALNVKVVIVFAVTEAATGFMRRAIQRREQKIWIASEGWSRSNSLSQMEDVEALGVVLGFSLHGIQTLAGFPEFVARTVNRPKNQCAMLPPSNKNGCNQECPQCLNMTAAEILGEDPTYMFSVYSAVYAVAFALHKVLNCGPYHCAPTGPTFPYKVTNALRSISFTLYNQTMDFDENGDPPAHYDIVYWDWLKNNTFEIVGFYYVDQNVSFRFEEDKIDWLGNHSAPEFLCSKPCQEGFRRVPSQSYTCCFECEICLGGTYMNVTVDPNTCLSCSDSEWSPNGSTSCFPRSLEFLHSNDVVSIGLFFSAGSFIAIAIVVAVLFAYNLNTPVVRSAGGRMCFVLLLCLSLSAVSVFFFVGMPTQANCVLRNTIFCIFYSGCLSCLAVRSFQIVCVFKMAAKLPRAYDYWARNNGQWLVILFFIVVQALLCGLWVGVDSPQPNSIKLQTQILFYCSLGNYSIFYLIMLFLGLLSVLCFVFGYMGTDLPKDYNEGKAITFSMFIFYLSWAVFLTVTLSSGERYAAVANAISILTSLYGILYGYFLPKCYIIVFKPSHNTPAYFQSTIQSYTFNTSSM